MPCPRLQWDNLYCIYSSVQIRMVISARQGWHDDMFIPALSCNIVYHLSYLLGTLSNWRFFHIINPSVYDCDFRDCQNVSNMCVYFSGPMPGIYKYRGANSRPWTIEATLLTMELPIMVTVVPRDGIDELVSSRRNEATGCSDGGSVKVTCPLPVQVAVDVRSIWKGVTSILSGHRYSNHLPLRLIERDYHWFGLWL